MLWPIKGISPGFSWSQTCDFFRRCVSAKDVITYNTSIRVFEASREWSRVGSSSCVKCQDPAVKGQVPAGPVRKHHRISFFETQKRNRKHPELSSLEGCNLLGPGFWQMESSNCIAGDGRTFKYNEFDHLFWSDFHLWTRFCTWKKNGDFIKSDGTTLLFCTARKRVGSHNGQNSQRRQKVFRSVRWKWKLGSILADFQEAFTVKMSHGPRVVLALFLVTKAVFFPFSKTCWDLEKKRCCFDLESPVSMSGFQNGQDVGSSQSSSGDMWGNGPGETFSHRNQSTFQSVFSVVGSQIWSKSQRSSWNRTVKKDLHAPFCRLQRLEVSKYLRLVKVASCNSFRQGSYHPWPCACV